MVLADSPSLPRSEFKEATDMATDLGWNLNIIETDEFQNEEYLKNDGKRSLEKENEIEVKPKD